MITAGRGRMLVGEEEREVGPGDLVYVPSGALNGIENASEEVLTYVSAATPALDAEAAHDTGQLRPESKREGIRGLRRRFFQDER